MIREPYDTTEKILDAVQKIANRHETRAPESGEMFNLLVISGLSRLEVNMCRILAELINPDGVHGQGRVFLKSFVRDVLNIAISDAELEKARVHTEYCTSENRRIDIAIETPDRFIPIEAKIYAKDQKKQCADYYSFAKERSKAQTVVYYLTPDGHLPAEDDGLTPVVRGGVTVGYEELETISFNNDIYQWLNTAMELVADKPVLCAALIQIRDAIGNRNERMKREMYEEIASLISENSQTMNAAYAIAQSLDVAGEKLVIKLLERLENEVKQLDYPLKQLNNKYDYKHNNYSSVRDYYSCKRNRIFPALVYSYKKLGAGKEIWFVIEVSSYGTAYLGFLVANYGEKTDKLLVSVRELEKHINLKYGTNKDECWFFWQYMPEGTADFYDIGKFPDFKAQNEPYRRLFDEEYFESYVGLCVTQIKAVLNGMTGGKEEQPYENS